jgi:ABC-type nitrate/sulfonate/bicarbonate transport system substrate-binding protein
MMNNQTTIKKDEAGVNETLTVQAGSQDIIVNVIEDTLARGYEVTKQVVYMTNNKSYRSYVMVTLSKKEVKAIIEEINKKKVAFINPKKIEESANKILKK